MSTIVSTLGYCAYDYASENYCAGVVFQADGIQFKALVSPDMAIGLQWRNRIDKADVHGIRFLIVNTQESVFGFQYSTIQSKSTGFQFRVAIYNVTNLRILSDFPSRGLTGANWTSTSTRASSTNSFNVNNLNTDIVEQVWRSESGNPGTVILTCDTQVVQGVFVDTLAILNHNFGGNTTVRLERSTNNITWELQATLIVERENAYYIAPSLPLLSYRYWRLFISDNSLDYFQIGTVVFGSAIIFQGEQFVDRVKFGKKQFADKVFTEGHTNVANDRGRKKYLTLDFNSLNYSRANFQQLSGLFDSVGTLLKCLYIPTPGNASRFAVFGKTPEIPEEDHNTKGDDYVSLTINVDESL